MTERIPGDSEGSSKISTIKLKNSTKDRLEHLKVYPRETYEEILLRVLDVLNLVRVNPERARTRLLILDKQRRRNFKITEPEPSKQGSNNIKPTRRRINGL